MKGGKREGRRGRGGGGNGRDERGSKEKVRLILLMVSADCLWSLLPIVLVLTTLLTFLMQVDI
jgi:hypothetical protein